MSPLVHKYVYGSVPPSGVTESSISKFSRSHSINSFAGLKSTVISSIVKKVSIVQPSLSVTSSQ